MEIAWNFLIRHVSSGDGREIICRWGTSLLSVVTAAVALCSYSLCIHIYSRVYVKVSPSGGLQHRTRRAQRELLYARCVDALWLSRRRSFSVERAYFNGSSREKNHLPINYSCERWKKLREKPRLRETERQLCSLLGLKERHEPYHILIMELLINRARTPRRTLRKSVAISDLPTPILDKVIPQILRIPKFKLISEIFLVILWHKILKKHDDISIKYESLI